MAWLKAGFRYWKTSSSGPSIESRQLTGAAQAKPVVPPGSPPKVTVVPAIRGARSIGTLVICPKSKTMAGSTPNPPRLTSWEMAPRAMRPVSWSWRSAEELWKLRFCPCSMTTPPAMAMRETATPTSSSMSVKPTCDREMRGLTGDPPG